MRAVKLTFKLPALIIITVLLTALAIGILVTTVLRQYLEDQAREENLQSVQIYASAIRYYLDDARSILDLSNKRSGFVDFSSSQPIDPILHGLPEDAFPTTRQALRDILATSKTFEYVAFLKEDGSVLMLEPYSLQVKLSTDSLFYTVWYRQLAATGQSVVSNLNISPATQQPTIVIATPIHNSNRRIVGILMGGLKLNELSLIGASSPNSLPLSHVGYLTDNHGLIIAHQAISSYVQNQTDFSSVPAVRMALAGEHGTARYINPIEQVEKLGAYLPLVNPPWAVVYAVPTSVALAPLRELFLSTLLVALGIVLVLGLLSIVIVRQITSPLSRLSSAARLIGSGDLNLRVKVTSSDELGTLTGVFNQMADSLEEKEARLQEFAGGLEQKVNQRTAALQASEERYHSLFENMVNGYAYCQMFFENDQPQDFIYLEVNSVFEKLTGLKDVEGKRVSEVIPGIRESNPEILEIYGRVTRTGNTEEFETYVESLGIWFSVAVYSPGKDTFVAVFDNITVRKLSEDALRNYSQRLAVINRLDHVISSSLNLDTVYDAFVIEMKELVTFDRTAIVLLDEACENWQILRQWTLGEPAFQPIVCYPIQGLALEWVVEHQEAFLEETLGEKTEWPEHQGLRREGLQSRVLLPLIIQGNVIGLLTLASRKPKAYQQSDLELLQTLADQLAIAVQNANLYGQAQLTAEELEQRVQARTAQLEKANKDLESFSYSVSHDLRAPLRAINGFSQILTRRHREYLDEEGRHYLDNVVEASDRMGVLIDDLLQYSRVGRASVHRQSVLLEDLFAQVLGDLASRIDETRAVVELPSSGNIPRILSDSTILGQIFTNIIANALTYHRPGIPPLIQVSYQIKADQHLFGIADNGIGIQTEYLDKIFNVFQRLHSPEQYPGTGIGLAIVKKSAELLGGQVWAESTVGSGTTFWIKIPKE